MTTTTPGEAAVTEIAAGLRAALEHLAGALARGDADAVLDAEPLLQGAVARQFTTMGAIAAADRDLARHDLAGARAALARCRALGTSAALTADAALDALRPAAAYNRSGTGPSRPVRGRGLKARG